MVADAGEGLDGDGWGINRRLSRSTDERGSGEGDDIGAPPTGGDGAGRWSWGWFLERTGFPGSRRDDSVRTSGLPEPLQAGQG